VAHRQGLFRADPLQVLSGRKSDDRARIPGLSSRSVPLETWEQCPFYNHVPDFNLLAVHDMKRCFPDAGLHRESVFGPTMSIVAVHGIGKVTVDKNKTG
jgi:hypothetical protein